MPFSLSSLDDVAEAEEGGQGPVKPKPFSLSSLDQDQGPGPKPFSLSSLDDEPAPTVEGKILAMPGLTDAEKLEHRRTIHRNRFAQAQAGNAEGPGPMGFGETLASSMLDLKEHPLSTLGSVVSAPARSLMTALAPGQGDVAPKPGSIAYGAMYSRVSPEGGTAADQSLAQQHVVTPEQRALATAQTMANIGAPGLGAIPGGALAMTAYGAENARTPQELAAYTAMGAGMGAVAKPLHAGVVKALHATDFTPGMMEAGAKGVGAAMRGENTIDLRLAERGRLDEMQKHLDQRFANAPLEPTTPAGPDWWEQNQPPLPMQQAWENVQNNATKALPPGAIRPPVTDPEAQRLAYMQSQDPELVGRMDRAADVTNSRLEETRRQHFKDELFAAGFKVEPISEETIPRPGMAETQAATMARMRGLPSEGATTEGRFDPYGPLRDVNETYAPGAEPVQQDQIRQPPVGGASEAGQSFGDYLAGFNKKIDNALDYTDAKMGPGEQAQLAAKKAGKAEAPGVRDANGRLRKNLGQIPEDALMREILASGSAASTENIGQTIDDSDSTQAAMGRPWAGNKGASVYALGRVASRKLGIKRIQAELDSRWAKEYGGMDVEDLHENLAKLNDAYDGSGDDMVSALLAKGRIDAITAELGKQGYDAADLAHMESEDAGFDYGNEARSATGADRGGTPGLAGVGADAGAGGAAGGTGAAGEQVAGDPALGRPGYAPQDPQELSREAQPGDAEQEPERVDLFGNAVAPTAEQGSLFGPSAGAAKAETPGAISPEEMSARRDELGAPKQPPIVGPGELFANPVGPVVRGAARGVQAAAGWARALPPIASIGDAWNRTFDPAARSVEAGETAGTMRTRLGEMAGTYERASTAMRDASAPTRGRKVLNALDLARPFDNASDAERLDFEDRMEHGQQQATPQLTAMAKAIRSSFDGVRDQIRQLGVGALDDFIENWFPHLWQDPQAATNAFAQTYGKRPMEGSKAFLKQRTVPTVKDGIARGLVPVTTNPVELSLLKLREMQRFLMAQQTMADLKTKGLLQLVPNGARAPQGFVRLNDKVARVPGQGEYWAPEPVARIMNNYLSPGLRGNGIFDAIHGAGKAINMAQLGLSAFHLGFTSLDAMTSRVALALEQFSHGKPLTAAGTMASSVAAPVSNIMSGASIRRAYLRPGEQGSAIGAALQTPVSDAMRGNWRTPQGLAKDAQVIGDWVERAGGRVKMDSFYHRSSVEKAVDALRQGQVAWGQGDLRQVAKQSGRFALNTIPGALQMAAKPIMEWVVPAQKLGVFGDLAREAMDQLPSTATRAQEDAVLQKVWNSVDNRMGQLVYDNLFWNKTFKDLSMAGVRSVGWNLGTVRELGGGVGDIVREGTRLAAGQDAQLSNRAAYVLALPITVGMMGAVINYLSTGEGPQESKDYFFPRTGTRDEDGNEDRVQLPSYMKDVSGFGANPWGTVKHKMSPAIAMIGEMLDNQNYYGDQIRNPQDPFVERRLQEAAYVAQALKPFSMQNAGEGAKRGDTSLLGRYGSSVGITPAPLRQTRSDAQNLMSDYLAERRVTGATPEDAEARLDRHNLLVDMRGGGTGDLADALDKALEHGAVTPAQFGKLLKRAGTTPMREQFGRLTTQQAMNVFQEADQPQRAQFLDLLSKKLTNAARTGGFAP